MYKRAGKDFHSKIPPSLPPLFLKAEGQRWESNCSLHIFSPLPLPHSDKQALHEGRRGTDRPQKPVEKCSSVFRPPLSPSLQATIIGRKLHGNWLLEGGGGGSFPPPNQGGVNYIPRKRVSLSPPSSSSSKAAQPDKKGTFMDHFCVESLRRHKTVFLPSPPPPPFV